MPPNRWKRFVPYSRLHAHAPSHKKGKRWLQFFLIEVLTSQIEQSWNYRCRQTVRVNIRNDAKTYEHVHSDRRHWSCGPSRTRTNNTQAHPWTRTRVQAVQYTGSSDLRSHPKPSSRSIPSKPIKKKVLDPTIAEGRLEVIEKRIMLLETKRDKDCMLLLRCTKQEPEAEISSVETSWGRLKSHGEFISWMPNPQVASSAKSVQRLSPRQCTWSQEIYSEQL